MLSQQQVLLLGSLMFGAACSSPNEPDVVFALGELDESGAVLVSNPLVEAIGGLQVRVRVATVAAECSERIQTRVLESESETTIEPMDEIPPRCSSRVAKIHLHDVTLDFGSPGPQTIAVRTATGDGDVAVSRHVVEVIQE